MIGNTLLAAAGLWWRVGTAFPLTEQSAFAVFETHPVPRSWKRVGDAPKNGIISLQIGLKQGSFDELERHLYEVSDPDHHRYGQHLTEHEVNKLIRPSDETLNLVRSWLADQGIQGDKIRLSPAEDWINVPLSVEEVEQLLDTKYSSFQHEDGSIAVRAPSWSLPKHLHDHIETIQPTNSFFHPLPRRKTFKIADEDFDLPLSSQLYTVPAAEDGISKVCNASLVTPLCLRTLYKTIDYEVQSEDDNKVGLTDYLGETNVQSDMDLFLKTYRPDAAAFEIERVSINKGDISPTLSPSQISAQLSLEGNLDAETIVAMTFPTTLVAYATGGSPPILGDPGAPNTNEPYLEWIQYLLKQSEIAQTISTSYGDDERTVPPSYAKSVCKGFAQLGARGVSLLFSSGDSGVGGDGQCISSDGKNKTTFLPSFPASCPYVTAVGATMDFSPEVAAHNPRNGFTSGGGYSNYFDRPWYQEVAVNVYADSFGDKFSGYYNPKGRAYPDVAAQGRAYATIWNGKLVPLDGTSASSPAFASVISLVNDALIAEGRNPLGFLNPFLYTRGFLGFNDITSGSSIGCGTDGFPAATGWDPVTGLGTPDFLKLKALAGVPS